jgi:hypothetical protein
MQMSVNRRFWLCCAVMAFIAGGSILDAESLRIIPTVRAEDVVVSFELADAYTKDVREAISSGLRTTFTYDVELRMVGPLWVDRTIARVVVTTTDQFDNLTRRHTLSRTVNGQVEESLVTEDEAAAGRWLTTFATLPLCNTSQLDASRDYYVRITARSRPRGTSLLGWASSITGQTKFTFIP